MTDIKLICLLSDGQVLHFDYSIVGHLHCSVSDVGWIRNPKSLQDTPFSPWILWTWISAVIVREEHYYEYLFMFISDFWSLGCLTLAALDGVSVEGRDWLGIIVVICGWLCVVIGVIYCIAVSIFEWHGLRFIQGCCCSSAVRAKRAESV